MFEYSSTTEIIAFLNSIIRIGKLEAYYELADNAVAELEDRGDIMAILYRNQVNEAKISAKQKNLVDDL